MNYLQNFQTKLAPVLQSYFDKKIQELSLIHPVGKKLGTIIRDFTIQGGKKFRPSLFFAAYTSYETKKLSEMLDFSVLFEIIQSFALIHDDIMDHSPLRRGRPTLHMQYDEGTALLLGDLTLMLADELFTRNIFNFNLSDNRRKRCIDCYNELKQEVWVGQYLDYIKHEDTGTVMLLKSARYSFMRPVALGLILADAKESVIDRWKELAEKIGIIFQLKDDYIGTFGTEENIGKSVTSDMEEGKNTLIVKTFLKEATSIEMNLFKAIFGKGNVLKRDFLTYRSLLRKKGIDKIIQRVIMDNAAKAKKEMETFSSSLPLSRLLSDILLLLTDFSH